MGRYVSEAQLRAYTNSTITADSAEYVAAIATATQQLDIATGRRIELATGSATARTFRPDPGTDVLRIDDCVSVTGITDHTTALTVNVHYVLEPLNGRTLAGETRPYDRAIRVAGCWYHDGPIPRVTVTADWGWAAVPDGAITACKVLAKAILQGRDITHGIAALTEGGAVTEREAKSVRDFIRDYAHPLEIALA